MKGLSNLIASDLRSLLFQEENALNAQKSDHQIKAEKRKAYMKVYMKTYMKKNKEKKKVYDKVYGQRNKDKINVVKKAYYQKNKDKRKATQKSYRQRNQEKINAYNKIYYQEHKDKYKRYRKDRYKWIFDLKRNQGCSVCGEKNPVCLDFDHIDSLTKKYNVSDMVRRNFSKEIIENEIAKCQILCSNCHRKKTASFYIVP